MDKKIFYQKLAELLEMESAEINDELLLQNTGWDSLVVMMLIAMIDENYQVTVPSKELLKCQTVYDVFQLVQKAVEEK